MFCKATASAYVTWLSLLALLLQVSIRVTAGAEAGDRPKIGILAGSSETKTFADILTAQWSVNDKVSLLERTALDKVLAEQTSAANSQTNYLKLGQLLGADGLIVLETAKLGTNSLLAARLIAVNTGVVLDTKGYSLPISDPEAWSEFMVRTYDPLLAKLKVQRSLAVPISILNLRASLDSKANSELEQQLTALTANRLTRQREVFVLERQRLEQLTWEKELSGVDETSFWTGSFLLEGTIDKNGFDPLTMTVSAHLLPAKGGRPIPIEISGSRTNLAAIVDALSRKVAAAALNQTDWPPWDAKAEADNYFDEAIWAARWKLYGQAREAIDASWALGRKTAETARQRVEICLHLADSHADPIIINYRKRGLTGRPSPTNLHYALSAFTIYGENLRQKALLPGPTENEWLEQGLRTLDSGSKLLEHYRYVVRAQRGNEERLQELQTACLEMNGYLEAHLPKFVSNGKPAQDMRLKLYKLQLMQGSYWFSQLPPAEHYYQQLIKSELYPRCREDVLKDSGYRLKYWHQEDLLEARAAWERLLDTMSRSAEFRERCDGQMLRLRDLDAGELPENMTFSGSDKPPESSQTELQRRVQLVLDVIWNPASQDYTSEAGVDMVDAFEELVARKCSGWKTPVQDTLMHEQKAREYGRIKHRLRFAKAHDADLFSVKYSRFSPSPQQARELLPLILDYQHRFPKGDWIRTFSTKVQKSAAYSTDELLKYLPVADTYDPVTFPYLFANRNYNENEAEQLRPLFEAYAQRIPAAKDMVESLLKTRLQSTASRSEMAQKELFEKLQKAQAEHERIVTKLKKTLETGATFDNELVGAIWKPRFFSRDESRLLLKVIMATPDRKRTPELDRLEMTLRSTRYSWEDIKDYFAHAQHHDEEMLHDFFHLRTLTPEEANELKPLWEQYKSRLGASSQGRIVDLKIKIALRNKDKR